MKRIFLTALLGCVMTMQVFAVQDEEFAVLLQNAQQGDTAAQNTVGDRYRKGKGVEQNYEQAFYWYQKAAEQGSARSMHYIAYMYDEGMGVPQDKVQAFQWYKKAAELGVADAQYWTAAMYEVGTGVEQNIEQAFYWYKKGAEQGEQWCQYRVGLFYEKGKGVPQNYAQAVYWYRKAAEQGHADAQNKLGTLYHNAQGVERDYKQALYWYEKAAAQENKYACNNIGILYEYGLGVTQDYAQAVYWYRKAAEKGYADAQNSLGAKYHNGQGVAQDYKQALYWYYKAAEQGNMPACRNIGVLYEYGNGVKKNCPVALYWYKRAIDGGYTKSNTNYDKLISQGYKPATEDPDAPKLPPLLVMQPNSLTFVDASGNNRIDAGEDCSIRFTIKNNGKGMALNCEARVKMSGTTSGVTVKNSKLPSIAPGKTQEVSIPVTANTDTKNGQLTFSIEVYEPSGWGIAPFDLAVETKIFDSPYLQVVDYAVNSPIGKIQKMVPFTLTFNLQNTKYGNAENVKVKVILPDDVYIMDGSIEQSFPLIKSGEAKSIKLTLAANNNYSTTDIPIVIDVKERYGKYAENKKLNIALNQSAAVSINIAAKDEPQQERKEIQLALIKSDVDRNIPTTNASSPNTFVLILANEHYQQVATVPFALNDGNIFREYCVKTLGISEKHIKYISDATGNQMKAGINWLANLTEAFDNPQIIVYYAGHGIPDESSKTAYLLPVDGIISDMSTCYKLDNLYATLGKMPASQITVFMDACFSGSKREAGMLASARGVALKAKSGVPQGNMVVFSAAQGDETAYPNREQQHGLFTYYLLKKLQETQGDIALKDLGEYIIKQVSQQSLLINEKKQTPCVTPSASLGSEWQNWKLK
ncbi:MAG: caspase family protein [Bacteroidales bacterium]|nr:caspase family protein [Bacteroidales bacterium]